MYQHKASNIMTSTALPSLSLEMHVCSVSDVTTQSLACECVAFFVVYSFPAGVVRVISLKGTYSHCVYMHSKWKLYADNAAHTLFDHA